MTTSHHSWMAEYETPDSRDLARAYKLILEDQAIGRARSMAKAIKDKAKAVRRAKSMCKVWYENSHKTNITGEEFLNGIWKPFQDKLELMEFNEDQINEIKRYGFDRGARLDLI